MTLFKSISAYFTKHAKVVALLTALAGSLFSVRAQKIAFLTDLHVGPGQESEAALGRIVEEVNQQNFDFAVITGDLTNMGSDAELIATANQLRKLTIPYHVIPGNHETNWSESAGQSFGKIFGDDKFYFEFGDYRFIGYSTGPYMKMGDGNIRREDLRWITETLKRNSGKKLISLSHYPLGDGLDNWKEITTILLHHKAVAALCGHGHQLSLQNFGGIPGIMGRSSLARGYSAEGYNIIELRNDSMHVYAKTISSSPVHFISFSLLNNQVLAGKPPSPEIDYSINDRFAQIVPRYQIKENASIFTGALPVSEKLLVYGNSLGEIVAHNPKKKKDIWRKKLQGSIYSTPALAGKLIVVGTIDGKILGLDPRNGQTRWTITHHQPVISDPVTEGNHIYIGAGSTSFLKIDASSGKTLWRFDSIVGQLQGRPTIGENEVVFGAWDRHIYCLDKETGQLRWKWNNGSSQRLYSPGNIVPAIANSKVFIVAPDRYMTAIDLQTGKTVWRNNQHRVRESMTISPDASAIYAKLMNDSVIAVSTLPSYFELLWKGNAGFGYEHNPCPPLATGGIVYAGTKNGELAAMDAKTGSLLWRHKSGNSAINKIYADPGGNIWISLIEGSIFQYKHQHKPN